MVWTRGLNDREVLITGMRQLSRDYIPSFLHSASQRADHTKQRAIHNSNLRNTIPNYTSITQATPWNIDLYDRLCVMANAPTVIDRLDIGTLVTQQELKPLTIPLVPQMEPVTLFHASPIYIYRTIRHPPEHNVNDVSIRVDAIRDSRDLDWKPRRYRKDLAHTLRPARLGPPIPNETASTTPDWYQQFRMGLFLRETRPILRRLPSIPLSPTPGLRYTSPYHLRILQDDYHDTELRDPGHPNVITTRR